MVLLFTGLSSYLFFFYHSCLHHKLSGFAIGSHVPYYCSQFRNAFLCFVCNSRLFSYNHMSQYLSLLCCLCLFFSDSVIILLFFFVLLFFFLFAILIGKCSFCCVWQKSWTLATLRIQTRAFWKHSLHNKGWSHRWESSAPQIPAHFPQRISTLFMFYWTEAASLTFMKCYIHFWVMWLLTEDVQWKVTMYS